MKSYILFVVSVFLASISTYALASNNNHNDELLSLSLEELISLEVTSVTRKKQRLIDSAAAIFVITQEDIRRSGAHSIPDALRMVPGLQVAQMNANSWSISVRGFNYIFANKLLVLMDGRTLYTPLFSGVNWDVQDTLIEDIDRIEVIRGPGAALWGANAVNGVINIITKQARDTQNHYLNLGGGSQLQAVGSYRFGGSIKENIHYRYYIKSFLHNALANHNTIEANDSWNMNRLGFRLDSINENSHSITIQGDIYQGSTKPPLRLLDINSQSLRVFTDKDRDQLGANLIVNWKRHINSDNAFSIKGYYDYYNNQDFRIKTIRHTFDLESQQHVQWQNNHELIWGLGLRSSWFQLDDMNYAIVNNDSPQEILYSSYVQTEFNLPHNWYLTLSARLEHHTSTGFEFQPNARLAWKINNRLTTWLSLSRAVRTPAITDRDFETKGIPDTELDQALATLNLQGSLSLVGKRDMESEKLTAFEWGYRQQLTEYFSLDVSTFINDYRDLISLTENNSCPSESQLSSSPIGVICALGPNYTLIPASLTNGIDATAYGMEWAFNWQALDQWRIKADVSLFQIDAKTHNELPFSIQSKALIEGLSAKRSANIRSMVNLTDKLFFDTWIRYMGNNISAETDDYTAVDIQLTYHILDQFEISLLGKNLFSKSRLEFNERFTALVATKIEPSWLAEIQWRF